MTLLPRFLRNRELIDSISPLSLTDRKPSSHAPPMAVIQTDIRSAIHAASAFRTLGPDLLARRLSARFATTSRSWPAVRAFNTGGAGGNEAAAVQKVSTKPSVCTADELHYVSLANSDWRLALWRYTPPPQAPPRNHPLLLLSGVGTNAIGYDLSPESSFARYMSNQGFDTWVLEYRGAGLSIRGSDSKQVEPSAKAVSDQMEAAASNTTNGILRAVEESSSGPACAAESKFPELEGDLMVPPSTQISKIFEDTQLSERFNEIRGKLSSLMEIRQNSTIASQIRDLSERLINIIVEVSPQFYGLQDRLFSTIEDFQKQLDLIVKYDWDFDHYLEEDVPAAMEYVRSQSKPNDGKLLAIGHSMGGILLYAMLSRCGADGRDTNLAGVVTLASSLDYTTSKSTLRLLLPFADPTQVLNVPAVPLGALLAAAYPLSSRPPYVLAWLNNLISSEGMMHPELMKKFIFNNFCTIPAKLLLQLASAFREGGLTNREGTFFYKDHLCKTNVPILAFAGDQDLICPPEAVHETAKLVPKHLITYKVFGEPDGPHYAHYDLVGGKLAREQLYPCIIEFLSEHDSTS
uniref:AB hydrolase-1 domain-containing protein n=1 Tax=Kalanchoe fedtschenkoi TaxID=63787 RepID=A0A7N0U1H7_KALFE